MAETLTVDTTPDTEVLTADEQDSLEVGEKMMEAQDNLLAGKYKDAQELEKAYIELQSKLGEPREEAPTEEPSQELEIQKEEKETEEVDPNFLDRLWEEAKTEYTDATIKELETMSPKALARMHLEYRQANQTPEMTDKMISDIKGLAGGEKGYSNMLEWAKQNISEKEVSMYDAVMDKGDPLACFFAAQALAYRYNDTRGTEGRMLTGRAPKKSSNGYRSQAELVKAMDDSRYEKDPAYRQDVMDKLERSNLKF